MKLVKKSESQKFENSPKAIAFEYPMNDKDINGAVVELSGRYPDKGVVVNEVCKEMVYVIKGSGRLIVENKEIDLNEGDVAVIEPGEKYYWDANMTIFVPSTPAWYPEQHKTIN
jgi:mannose-6-phosphate isomerase-like protein (cupin superfamily)